MWCATKVHTLPWRQPFKFRSIATQQSWVCVFAWVSLHDCTLFLHQLYRCTQLDDWTSISCSCLVAWVIWRQVTEPSDLQHNTDICKIEIATSKWRWNTSCRLLPTWVCNDCLLHIPENISITLALLSTHKQKLSSTLAPIFSQGLALEDSDCKQWYCSWKPNWLPLFKDVYSSIGDSLLHW